MFETSDTTERRFSGTTRLFIGFVMGALFALVPMYYFYMGREAVLRQIISTNQGATPDAELSSSGGAPVTAGGPAQPFAARLTYELSRLPEEPLPVIAKASPPPVEPATRPRHPNVPPREPASAPRIADARPISALPPDPRDRTASIEEEAQKPEYRDARREPGRPRVFDGRGIDIKTPGLPQTPTRSITGEVSSANRAQAAAERSTEPIRSKAIAEAAGTPVAGVSPITRAPEKSPAQDLVAHANTAEPSSSQGRGAPSSAEHRIVDGRVLATREWLAGANSSTHTIQLMGAGSEEQLDAQLKSLGKVLEPAQIYVFRTIAQGKPWMTVVYGSYADRQSALQALEKLPAPVTANRPVLRTVNGIRAEMKRHRTDG